MSEPPVMAGQNQRKRTMFQRTQRDREIKEGLDDPTFSKTVTISPNPLGGLVFICSALQFIREDQHFRPIVRQQETQEAILELYRSIVKPRDRTPGYGEGRSANAYSSPPLPADQGEHSQT